MRVKTYHPVRTLRGTVGNSDIVYATHTDGRILARARSRPRNPNSPDQQKIRAYLTAASKAWATLSDAQRDGWRDYAAEYYPTNNDGEPIEPAGLPTFVRANSIRQILGLAIVSAPPTLAPPPPISAILQNGAEQVNAMVLTLTHPITTVAGFKVLVRATPGMTTQAQTPQSKQLRYVRGVAPSSAYTLLASNAAYEILSTRYPYPEEVRFGVEVRIVRTADGIQSLIAYGEFRKAMA